LGTNIPASRREPAAPASSRAGAALSRGSLGLAGAVGLAAALGCSLFLPQPTPVPEVDAVLDRFGDPQADADAAFLDLAEAMTEDPLGVEATALGRLDDPNPEVRLMAVYALAETASTPAGLRALRQELDAEDPTERALAAEGLLRRGESQALPVLIGLLDDETPLRGAEPPVDMWGFASELLLRYTDRDFGLSTAESIAAASEAKPAWEQWWQSSAETIEWNEDEQQFRSLP